MGKVNEFAATFSDDFRVLAISPETGTEQVRRMNKGYYYSNQQMYEMLDYFAEKDLSVNVYLTYGIPGENEERLLDTSLPNPGVPLFGDTLTDMVEVCVIREGCNACEMSQVWRGKQVSR